MDQLVQPILQLLVTGVSVFIVAKLLPGVQARSFGSALVFAFLVGILNALAWKALGAVTLPAFLPKLAPHVGSLVINALVFLVAGRIVKGMEFSGCIAATIASVCVTLLNSGIYHLLRGVGRAHGHP